LIEIIDPILVRGAAEEQLATMTMVKQKCLTIRGEDTPHMKEVTLELEGLKEQIRHGQARQY